jgi:hypothetical protein
MYKHLVWMTRIERPAALSVVVIVAAAKRSHARFVTTPHTKSFR